jgi:hypothetical protein
VRDTHPKAEAVLVEGLRRMSSAEKLARVAELRQMALDLAYLRRWAPSVDVADLLERALVSPA